MCVCVKKKEKEKEKSVQIMVWINKYLQRCSQKRENYKKWRKEREREKLVTKTLGLIG